MRGRGGSRKTNIDGEVSKKWGLAQFVNLRGLGKKYGGGVFEGA